MDLGSNRSVVRSGSAGSVGRRVGEGGSDVFASAAAARGQAPSREVSSLSRMSICSDSRISMCSRVNGRLKNVVQK